MLVILEGLRFQVYLLTRQVQGVIFCNQSVIFSVGIFMGIFLNFNVIKRYFFRILTLLSVKFGRLVVSSLIIKLAGVM